LAEVDDDDEGVEDNDDDHDDRDHDDDEHRAASSSQFISEESQAANPAAASPVIAASSWRELQAMFRKTSRNMPSSCAHLPPLSLSSSSVRLVLAQQRSRVGRQWTMAKFSHTADFIVLPDVAPPSSSSAALPSLWDLFLQVGVYESGRCETGPATAVVTNRHDCVLPDDEDGSAAGGVIQPLFSADGQ
jgi:hypothetical protein